MRTKTRFIRHDYEFWHADADDVVADADGFGQADADVVADADEL